jgi:citrate lyase subunit beta / citryl-CoA lyase
VISRARHPRIALFQGERPFPIISACEHYAGSEKLIKKAIELQRVKPRPFDVTLDLEDGAPEGRERAHAEMIVDVLRTADAPGRRGVRIHGAHHPHWRADVEIVIGGAGDRIDYLTIPKARGASEVREVAAFAREVARSSISAKPPTPLHVLIETHGALAEVFDIAAIEGIEVLDFGLMDFISGHHGAIDESCMRSPGQFEHALLRRAKSEIVAAALRFGAVPAHNVTIDFKDRTLVHADATRAKRELGFLRMWSIHPDQIDPILDAMAPGHSEIERASRVLLEAEKKDWAPIALEGRLYDRASYRYHWELLERAHLAGANLDEAARSTFFAFSED